MNNIETQNNKGEIVMYQLNDMVKLVKRFTRRRNWKKKELLEKFE